MSLVVFTCPKPFSDAHIAVIQLNALRSWSLLAPRPRVLLIGGGKGSEGVADEPGLEVVEGVERNAYGTPLVCSLFKKAWERSCDGDILVYVNADIILMQDFMEAVGLCCELKRPFVMVGRRWDLDVDEELDFSDGWADRLREEVKARGVLHAPSGLDYFVFRRGLWGEIPPFALGRFSWDNWLLAEAGRLGAMRIDASNAVMAVHQNHGYTTVGFCDSATMEQSEEAARNRRLAGNMMANTLDCEYVLRDGKVCRALDVRHVTRRAHRFVFNTARSMCPAPLRPFAGRCWERIRDSIGRF